MSSNKSKLAPAAVAAALAAKGYYPLPIVPGTKAVSVKNWVELLIKPADVPRYFDPSTDVGVGLLLGQECAPRCYPVAIDIDLEDGVLVERIALAFDKVPPAKRGAKGITYFARVGEPVKKRLIQRRDPITNSKTNAVEILAAGQQTVLPPSVHPKGMEYEWVGAPLYDFDPADLPELTAAVVREIEVAVNKPSSSLFLINVMTSGAGQGGGTIHDSVLTAVAVMTSLGWGDDTIWCRVERATRAAVAHLDEIPREYEPERWEPVVRRMINDARAKGFDQVKKRKIHFVAARWLLDVWHGPNHVRKRDSQLHSYEQGWWRGYTDADIRHQLATNFPEPTEVSLIHEDWSRIVSTALDMATPFPHSTSHRRVCLQNGTVDMDTGELRPWSPEDFLISQLPFAHDPMAKCPVYDAMVRRAFNPVQNGHDIDPDDLQRSIDCYEEFVAHSLFECLDFHKFLVIKGKPRSGKSTLTRIARMLHGKLAVSGVPVQEFGNERYRTAMVGKLLNIVNEVAATSHAADDFLKSVTAGDEIQVRFLYKEPELVQLPARIIIACNEMFRVRDTSGAIEARMLILSCDNHIEEAERDVRILDKLRAELPGIFNRMVIAWHRLRDRGRFELPKGADHELSEFTTENNVVLAWLKECTWQGAALDGTRPPKGLEMSVTEVGEAYMHHAEWSKMNGHKQISKITFGMKLSQIKIPNFDMSVKLIRVADRVVRVRPFTLMDKGRI